ncbi:hypothetical protein [Peribacillus sp. ACCC06369]|uniref:hypothetical protein n=1 Tax=Peribacillus sp. ACCC06369 TaxID=3055860 RepID=UPI0025A079A5|nr:hypothetical protein [Peribacillus sp. ACCC06369]MDM5361167.1 hypothetical protein [Peribacillus sp. ACCC06369]
MGGKMWDKIELYFFDIIGILIPGIIFLSGITFTSLFLISGDLNMNFNEIFFIDILIKTSKELTKNMLFFVVFFLFNAYLVGIVIKVLSKLYYEIFEIIFDKFLNRKFTEWWKKKQKRKEPDLVHSEKDNNFWNKFIKEIFEFGVDNYRGANKVLLDESKMIIKKRYNTDFPKDDWLFFEKLSKIIIYSENIKCLNDTFLAKYTFYRSLSFISFLQIFLIVVLFFLDFFLKDLLNDYSNLLKIPIFLIIINIIFWYSFHEKYKRYFRYCGNETLVTVYYHLKKTEQTPDSNKDKTLILK